MLKHLTLLDLILWIGIVIIQVKIFIASKSKFKVLPFVLLFILIESAIEIPAMFCSELTYKHIYYSLSIIESIMLSIGAIEIGGSIAPDLKSFMYKFGPFAIVAPAFITYIALSPDKHFHYNWLLLDDMVRIFQLVFLISLIFLLLCISMEDYRSENKLIARGYATLLGILTASLQIQTSYGLNRTTRTALILSWLIGSFVLALTFRCMNNGNTSIQRKGFKAYGSSS